MSAHQLHRSIGVTYKTAWFMWHRIREAYADVLPPMGGAGKVVGLTKLSSVPLQDVFVNGRGWQKARGTSTKRIVVRSLSAAARLTQSGGQAGRRDNRQV